jgi:quercetin dioxygenase-like cupin family protein
MNIQTRIPYSDTTSTFSATTSTRSAPTRANRRTLFVILGLAAALSWTGFVSATPANGFASDVAKASFDSLRIIYSQEPKIRLLVNDPADYYAVTNTVMPGGYSGWHTHPGPSVVVVKSGVATVYDGDDPTCTPEVYPAGTGFIDAGDGHLHMVRNEGADTLVTQALQHRRAGGTRRNAAPSPGTCPF